MTELTITRGGRIGEVADMRWEYMGTCSGTPWVARMSLDERTRATSSAEPADRRRRQGRNDVLVLLPFAAPRRMRFRRQGASLLPARRGRGTGTDRELREALRPLPRRAVRDGGEPAILQGRPTVHPDDPSDARAPSRDPDVP